jgi:hypothetical protein
VQESLGSIVLGFEVIIVFLGALVVFGLGALPAPVALGGGAALVVVMIITLGLLRHRWAFVVGWAIQVIVILSGFLVGMLFVVGAIFLALWAYCMIQGSRIDRANRQRAEALAAPDTLDESPSSPSNPEVENTHE